MKKTKLFSLLLALALILMSFCALAEVLVDESAAMTDEVYVEYGYDYSTPDEVALYLHAFEELPPNYITKSDARDLGWDSSAGNLWDVAPGCSIGGDRFGNREGLLPKGSWYECDVNYEGGYRGAERLLFSEDGMICYSGDHYNSYEVLYEGWYYEDGYYRGITEY